MNRASFFDELAKLGAISDEQAQKSIEQLEQLERNKPTLGQVGRYAGLGALAGPAISTIGNVVAGKKALEGGLRGIASKAVTGALSAGAVPLARSALDRRASIGQLKKYMQQEHIGDYGKNPEASGAPAKFESSGVQPAGPAGPTAVGG
jgi:hypothetical protein